MDAATTVLMATAAGIGLGHTLAGPDHYLPFIMMSRARRWRLLKTLVITFFCGIGHVLSSVVLGFIGIAIGVALTRIEGIEGTRGEIAAWLLIAFGVIYAAWGLRRARRSKTHAHGHLHAPAATHAHEHAHTADHAHVHTSPAGKVNITPWVLFVIFVLGPCEPLIPLLMYPAAKNNLWAVAVVTGVFGGVTVATMLVVVTAGALGLRQLRLGFVERYVHALAGGTIAASGLAVKFLGL